MMQKMAGHVVLLSPRATTRVVGLVGISQLFLPGANLHQVDLWLNRTFLPGANLTVNGKSHMISHKILYLNIRPLRLFNIRP
jgi:hypothetical protein